LDHFGPIWYTLDQIGPDWIKLDQIVLCHLWTTLDRIGPLLLVICPLSCIFCPLSYVLYSISYHHHHCVHFYPSCLYIMCKSILCCSVDQSPLNSKHQLMCWQAWLTWDKFGPLWTSLVYSGPNWTRLDQIGPDWTKLDQICHVPVSCVMCPMSYHHQHHCVHFCLSCLYMWNSIPFSSVYRRHLNSRHQLMCW
jgi:hypothetical protein